MKDGDADRSMKLVKEKGIVGTLFDFFFSSRRRHTRSKRDWSSDVCSSDLSIGSTDAARRAGYSAARTAIVPNNPAATIPDFQVGNSPAKKSGMGSKFTSAQNP